MSDKKPTTMFEAFGEGKGKFDLKAASNMMSNMGHGGFLGIEYSDHGDDWAELSMDWREDLVADPEIGIFASSAVISLMDNACAIGILAKQGFFRPQVTMDLRLDYLRPSPPHERIYGRGECYHMNVAFVRGVAHNGNPDEPVAYASGTFVRVQPNSMARF